VREAVARLASEGLASSDPWRGAIVAELSMLDFIEINQLRLLLESYSARVAAEMIPTEEIDRLEEDLAAAKTEGNDAVMKVDQDIHRTLARYCRNSRIERMIIELNDCMAIARVYDIQGRHDNVLADLERLIADLRNRDGDAAAALMHDHIQAFYSVIDPRAASERSVIGPYRSGDQAS
jgi:DNA-binding GntR family transcriptional regulator